jgi:uncharacterized protein YbbC (DUF1343 family)
MRLFYLLLFLLFFGCTRQTSSSQTGAEQTVAEPSAAQASGNATPAAYTQPPANPSRQAGELTIGAAQLSLFLPELSGKRVGMVVNHTSLVGNTHLVDTLLSLNVAVKKIFAPEHGFRGEADAGEHVSSGVDKKTNLPLVSLYGSNKKPTPEQLADLDVVIFDIQDVGVRFYTYISTMHYVMEACAENKKKVIVLDRPNPHGHYFDGPVLASGFTSFVGMHPIPIVHGLTVAELANMINGQKWLANGVQCELSVVKNENYTHRTPYQLPVRPSPNLTNQQAIRLYPSICLFEGTVISVGRGTEYPFQVIGSPNPANGAFTFTPRSVPGAKNPPYLNQLCYGLDLREDTLSHFSLKYVTDFYQKATSKDKFFNSFFDKLAGNDKLRTQIQSGMSEAQIRETWKEDLAAYKALRQKYLLYAE